MFKYNKESIHHIKRFKDGEETLQQVIVIARMDAMNNPDRYMVQDYEEFKEEGYRFDKGEWKYEKDLIPINN